MGSQIGAPRPWSTDLAYYIDKVYRYSHDLKTDRNLMLSCMPSIASAELLNSSALPHAPQVDDTESPNLLVRGLREAARLTGLAKHAAH